MYNQINGCYSIGTRDCMMIDKAHIQYINKLFRSEDMSLIEVEPDLHMDRKGWYLVKTLLSRVKGVASHLEVTLQRKITLSLFRPWVWSNYKCHSREIDVLDCFCLYCRLYVSMLLKACLNLCAHRFKVLLGYTRGFVLCSTATFAIKTPFVWARSLNRYLKTHRQFFLVQHLHQARPTITIRQLHHATVRSPHYCYFGGLRLCPRFNLLLNNCSVG